MSSSSYEQRQRVTVSQAELAWAFGVSTRTIQRWERDGLDAARVGTAATYDLRRAVDWLLERERTGRDTPELEQARTRLTLARAQTAEMELAIQRGDYMALDDAEAEIRRFAEDLNGALINAPVRHAPTLATKAKMKIPKATRILEELVEDVRKDLRALAEKQT